MALDVRPLKMAVGSVKPASLLDDRELELIGPLYESIAKQSHGKPANTLLAAFESAIVGCWNEETLAALMDSTKAYDASEPNVMMSLSKPKPTAAERAAQRTADWALGRAQKPD
jgi:hypothetical protein